MAAIETITRSVSMPSLQNAGSSNASGGTPGANAQVVSSAPAAASSQATQKQLAQQARANEQQQAAAERKVTAEELQQAVKNANFEMAGSNENISFGYEEKLGRLYVQVTDKNSGEVIREIPSKEFLQHQIAMREMIGLILDKKV